MSYEIFGVDAPGVAPCRYGESRLLFRGPKQDVSGPYVAVIGSTEVYGRFVDTPFTEILQDELGRTILNLGCINAGLDSFLHDTEILRLARSSDCCVVQLMGAQNLSNRYFRVHPRRNDRFLAATAELHALFPEVDFTEFHFNRHLLSTIRQISVDRFEPLRKELQRVWLSRMQLLLKALEGEVILLWLRYGPADHGGALDCEPPLVDAEMVAALSGQVSKVLPVELERADKANEIPDMVVGPMHVPAAGHVIGPNAHRVIARALTPLLRRG